MIETEKQNLVVKKPLSGFAKKISFIIPIIIALALFGGLSNIYAQQTGSDIGKSAKTGQSDKTNKGTAPASVGQEPPRRAKPAPLDGIFPSAEYLGPTPLIGVPDTEPVYPLTEALWSLSPALKKARIKVYGWVNPGISISTSDDSNIPESYAIVPNKPQLDQAILRFERLPDTVQTDHVDWGFRFTTLYGID